MPNKLFTSLIIFLCSLLSVPFISTAQDASISKERLSHFTKGVNLPGWLWLNRGDVKELQTVYPETEFQIIKKLGLTYVRIPIDFKNIYDPTATDTIHAQAYTLLDNGIRLIRNAGLGIIIDLHSIAQDQYKSDYSGPLGKESDFTAKFSAFWGHFAKRLSSTDPEWVILEPMNEPVFNTIEDKWAPIQEQVIAAIRKNAPTHTIIATGTRWSSLDSLLKLQPLQDPNILYNFHFYEPHLFTHQGATWSSEVVKTLREVPYPSTVENVKTAISLVQSEEAKRGLEQYGKEEWNAAKISQKMADVAEWAKKNKVSLLCNEFGVYNKNCLPKDRAAWIQDVRTAFEKNQIGWCMWTYDGSFGVVNRKNGKTTADPAIAKALGLNEIK